tara:strand:+ start:535 stop:708 length:174 start_codon:yes stop_codon:yes gene_type:complete
MSTGVSQSVVMRNINCRKSSLPCFSRDTQRIAEARVRKTRAMKKDIGRLSIIPRKPM